MIVERYIGVLKNVFRCTLGARQLHYKPHKAANILTVSCALNNLKPLYNVPMNDEDFETIGKVMLP